MVGSSRPWVILSGWERTPRVASRSLITCWPRAGRGGAGLLSADAPPGKRPSCAPPAGPPGAWFPQESPALPSVRSRSVGGPPPPSSSPGWGGYEKAVMESRLGSSLPAHLSKLHSIPEPLPWSLPSRGKGNRPGEVSGSLGFLMQTPLFTSTAPELPAVTGNALPRYPRPVKSSPSSAARSSTSPHQFIS